MIDGKSLTCNDPNGWKMSGESTVEITGSACADLKQLPSATINAEFACDTFIIF